MRLAKAWKEPRRASGQGLEGAEACVWPRLGRIRGVRLAKAWKEPGQKRVWRRGVPWADGDGLLFNLLLSRIILFRAAAGAGEDGDIVVGEGNVDAVRHTACKTRGKIKGLTRVLRANGREFEFRSKSRVPGFLRH